MRATALIAACVACAGCASDPPSTVAVVTGAGEPRVAVVAAADDGGLVAIRDAAHRVMSARCGECHESHRPTAKPAALAIFDLDQPDWPQRFDDHRFAAGLNRFGGATADDRAAFVAFRDAELAARRRDL